jgi:hypothetical protein
MLVEIGDCRERYPTYRALAADAGQCPVAVESGKSKHAKFRRACDHRLRAAFDTLADPSRHHNPWATDIYTRARARGATHPHAARILGRAWCQIIWRLWHDHSRLLRQRCVRGRSAVRPAASKWPRSASGEIRYLTWRPERCGRDSRLMAVDRQNRSH